MASSLRWLGKAYHWHRLVDSQPVSLYRHFNRDVFDLMAVLYQHKGLRIDDGSGGILLRRDRSAQSQLYTASRSYLLRQVGYIAPYLAPDRREDVVHQAWLDLLNKGPEAFQPSVEHKVQTFFDFLLWNAVKKVRAQYCPPGQRTRPKKDDEGDWGKRLPSISLDEIEEVNLPDDLVDQSAETELAVRIDAERVRTAAPDIVQAAIELLFWLGYSKAEAARQLGVSRAVYADR